MSTERRRFSPQTRRFNQRGVVRVSDNWGAGMVKDRVDLPKNAFADLVNARDFGSEVRGRKGTRLFTAANIGVTINHRSETLAQALASGGQIYTAKGSAPVTGDIFMVYGAGDTLDHALVDAKAAVCGALNGPPRRYDLFKVSGASLVYLGNMIPPAIHDFGDTVTTEITARKFGTEIEILSGNALTSDLEDHFFVWGDDGEREAIVSVTSSTTLQVVKSNNRAGSVAYCTVHAPIRASLYHRSANRFIMLVGSKLYVADAIPFTGWTEIPGARYQEPFNVSSKLYADGDDAILVNNYGQYRIKLEGTDKPYYWKMNEKRSGEGGTSYTIADRVIGAGTVLSRHRYLYTQSRIIGANPEMTRINAKDGAVLQQETAPAAPYKNDGRDYATVSMDYVLSTNDPKDETASSGVLLSSLVPGENQRANTHYSIYRTDNSEAEDADDYTVENVFIWVDDVPMIKPMRGIIASDGAGKYNLVISEGVLKYSDIGSQITFENGKTATIYSILSETQAKCTAATAEVLAGTPCAIGIGVGRDVFTVNQTGYTVTITAASTRTFEQSDVGKIIFFSSGSPATITKYVNATTVKVTHTAERTGVAAGLNPTTRKFYDTVDMNTLRARSDAGEPMYMLQNRFFVPLPNANISWLIPGFLVVAQRGYREFQYCMTGQKHLVGYHHPFQSNNKLIGGIEQMRAYPEALVMRGKNFTARLNTTISKDLGRKDFGESYLVLMDPEIVDELVGATLEGSTVRVESGNEIVFTTEPAVREFDGYKYGPNLAAEKIQESEIVKLAPQIIVGYSHNGGLNLFGKRHG